MLRQRHVVISLALVLVALFALTVSFAGGPQATTGQLLVEVAKAKGLACADAITAASSLRGAGFEIPDVALDEPLTEGTVARVAAALGLAITTANPTAPFSTSQVDAFLSSFGPELGRKNDRQGANSENGADPRTKGKGKKKGLYKTPSDPM